MRSRRGLSSDPGAVVTTVQEYLLFAEDPELRPYRAAATCYRCSNVDNLVPGGGLFPLQRLQGGRTPTGTKAESRRTPFQAPSPPTASSRIPSFVRRGFSECL